MTFYRRRSDRTKHAATAAWSRACVVALAFALGVLGRDALAQGVAPRPLPQDQSFNQLPTELEEVGIEDKPGAELPRDAELIGSDGRSFILGEYMDADKPLILVLAYYRCPMLCSMVLNGMTKAIRGMVKRPGADYRVLVVSFDPKDTTRVARDKRSNYVADLPPAESDVAWFEFATGKEDQVRRIADAVGFRYKWVEETQQYAHASGIFVVTPKGKLSQALTGIEFAPGEVDRAIVDADKETWHSPIKSVLLYCFTYDAKHGKYVPAVMNIMKLGAGITVLAVTILLVRLRRHDRKRHAETPSLAPASTFAPEPHGSGGTSSP
ncbi:MAG: SCO family protein [Polyangiaceae bacterium]